MTPATAKPPQRLASIDAYRGFVMFLMMGEVFNFCTVSQALPDSGFWKFLCWQQSHVQSVGCSLHDMIQPGFSFLVGVALPFSISYHFVVTLELTGYIFRMNPYPML